jgi:hypothetical protein
MHTITINLGTATNQASAMTIFDKMEDWLISNVGIRDVAWKVTSTVIVPTREWLLIFSFPDPDHAYEFTLTWS